MRQYASDKELKASFSVTPKIKSVGYLTPNPAFYLFDTYVSHILDYASENWSSTMNISCIEAVHHKCLNVVLGVEPNTCITAVLCKVGRLPM